LFEFKKIDLGQKYMYCLPGTIVSLGQRSPGTIISWNNFLPGTKISWENCLLGQKSPGTHVPGTIVSGTVIPGIIVAAPKISHRNCMLEFNGMLNSNSNFV
jgi:hypothetical protein